MLSYFGPQAGADDVATALQFSAAVDVTPLGMWEGRLRRTRITCNSSDLPVEQDFVAVSADAAALVSGNNRFALGMYQRLASNAKVDEHVLLSPFSISTRGACNWCGARLHRRRAIAA